MTDDEYDEKYAIAAQKWENGEDLTPEEEQMLLDAINGGDNMMGATT